jgi:hypothetical protein
MTSMTSPSPRPLRRGRHNGAVGDNSAGLPDAGEAGGTCAPSQLAAAFGFEPTAVLTAPTPKERRCVESPAALTLSSYAAAFGTTEPCVTTGAGGTV